MFCHLSLRLIYLLDKRLGQLMAALKENASARSMKARFTLPSHNPA